MFWFPSSSSLGWLCVTGITARIVVVFFCLPSNRYLPRDEPQWNVIHCTTKMAKLRCWNLNKQLWSILGYGPIWSHICIYMKRFHAEIVFHVFNLSARHVKRRLICIRKTSHQATGEKWDQPFGSNWLSNANNLLAMQMIFGKIGTAAD